MAQERFELVVDGVPYSVEATAFSFNAETRYRVEFNGREHIFTWDPRLGRLSAIDDDAAQIPVSLEEAIATRLRSSGRPA